MQMFKRNPQPLLYIAIMSQYHNHGIIHDHGNHGLQSQALSAYCVVVVVVLSGNHI